MKIRKFFYNAKISKKLLQCNDFNRLKKNKNQFSAWKLLKTLQKFEKETLPNTTSSRPSDWVTWDHHEVRNMLIHCKSFYIYGGTRHQYKNVNEIISESSNSAQILLSMHKKFEEKSTGKAFHKMAVTWQVGIIFYWNFH